MRLPTALRPLRHPRFRTLAISMCLSLASGGVLILALVWQVVALDGGPRQLSLVTAANGVGLVATALLGGVLADRVPQRRILMTTELTKGIAIGVVAALSLAGHLQVWHLAVAALLAGILDGLYYPAYSALVPALLPPDDLLAANGLEGMARPVLFNAAGPALAGAIVAAYSPGAALAISAVAALAAGAVLVFLPLTALRRDLGTDETHPLLAAARDLREGFAYLVRTPWLHATLAFASVMVLLVMGPFDVLLPFVIKDNAGGGPSEHALVLAAFGIGGAVGSLLVASRPMPRRYLTAMLLAWGIGCLPMALMGFLSSVAVMVVIALIVGGAFQGATVIWGTLLQRRVPPELLGRVSSLDFFVSLVFMPASMALAGPAAEWFGLTAVFVVAGVAPTLLAVVAIVAARLPADEIAHPLRSAEPEPEPEPESGSESESGSDGVSDAPSPDLGPPPTAPAPGPGASGHVTP